MKRAHGSREWQHAQPATKHPGAWYFGYVVLMVSMSSARRVCSSSAMLCASVETGSHAGHKHGLNNVA